MSENAQNIAFFTRFVGAESAGLSLSLYIYTICMYYIYIYIHTDTDTHVTFMHLPKPLKRVKHTLYDSPAMHNRGLLVTRDDEVTPHFLKGIWYFDIFGVSVLLNCLFRRTILGVSQNWQTENSWKSLKIMPFARKKAINDINQDIQCVIYRNAKFMLSQPTSTVSRYSTCSKISWSGNLMVRSNRQANLIFTPGAKRLCTCLKRPLVKKRKVVVTSAASGSAVRRRTWMNLDDFGQFSAVRPCFGVSEREGQVHQGQPKTDWFPSYLVVHPSCCKPCCKML